MREYHVRICEGLGVKFPGSTRQKLPRRGLSGMSALPPKAAAAIGGRRVRFGPETNSCSAANFHHSITSSAVASSVCGIVRPSALAVVRLMVRSNLVGCSTGMSPGFAPRKILST